MNKCTNLKVTSLFVNPKGQLCFTVSLFGTPLFTMIDVEPRFDGYDINGEVINENDWCWCHSENI